MSLCSPEGEFPIKLGRRCTDEIENKLILKSPKLSLFCNEIRNFKFVSSLAIQVREMTTWFIVCRTTVPRVSADANVVTPLMSLARHCGKMFLGETLISSIVVEVRNLLFTFDEEIREFVIGILDAIESSRQVCQPSPFICRSHSWINYMFFLEDSKFAVFISAVSIGQGFLLIIRSNRWLNSSVGQSWDGNFIFRLICLLSVWFSIRLVPILPMPVFHKAIDCILQWFWVVDEHGLVEDVVTIFLYFNLELGKVENYDSGPLKINFKSR